MLQHAGVCLRELARSRSIEAARTGLALRKLDGVELVRFTVSEPAFSETDSAQHKRESRIPS